MKTLEFRDLRADEIEIRVGNTKRKYPNKPKSDDNPVVGFQVLLYKTARVDANVLDETVGPFNWQKRFYQVKNTMICSVGIKDTETGEFIWKDDAGDDDFQAEQVKGEASDSFKRAAFAWGLGRLNLYYAPFIWVKCENDINEFSKLYVSEIAYKDHIISKLVIRERNTEKEIYSYPRSRNISQTSQKPQETKQEDLSYEKGPAREDDMEIIKAYMKGLNEEQLAIFNNWVQKICGVPVDLLNAAQAKVISSRIGKK